MKLYKRTRGSGGTEKGFLAMVQNPDSTEKNANQVFYVKKTVKKEISQ